MMTGAAKYLSVLLLLMHVSSCGPGRSLPEHAEPAPDWVSRRPVIPGYYIGIGWARKTPNVHQYQQTARQNALADLAGGISVTISSSSVLHAFESNLGFREDFSATVEARTLEDLEGYEMAGTWEDQESYWIYYRLSEARHREIVAKRREDAIKLASGHLEHALKARDDGQLRTSLVHLINSMEAIRNYLDDPLPSEFGGRQVQLGTEIFNELSATISQIEIEPETSVITVKTGAEIPSSLLRFMVTQYGGGPVPDFPLTATYTGRPIRNNRTRTARDGSAGFGIDVVRSIDATETFRVEADIEAILEESTRDPVIRRLIRRFGSPGTEVTIRAEPPVIAIISEEKNLGHPVVPGIIGESARKSLIASGYIAADDTSQADYILRINASTTVTGETGSYRNARLTGSLSLEQSGGRVIYRRDLEGFRGSHFSPESAGEEAFRQAARRTESSFAREIDETIKKR